MTDEHVTATRPLRILAVTHYWPQHPAGFTTDELCAWHEHHGAEIDVIAVRPTDAIDTSNLSVRYLNSQAVLRHTLTGLVRILLRPPAFRRAVLVATPSIRPGRSRRTKAERIRAAAHGVLTAVRALAAAGATCGNYDLAYADFANDEASIAWVVASEKRIPFLFRDHSSVEPPLLEKKLADATLVLACSHENKAALDAQAHNNANVMVSYLGVDTRIWALRPSGAQIDELIVCPARLQEKKGQRVLLEAFARLHRAHPTCRLVLAGDGPARAELQSMIDDLGLTNVEITGYLSHEQMHAQLQAAAIVCIPSVRTLSGDHDGIPVALMEAMALGKPCVSTAVGGIPELIEHQQSGYIVEDPTPEALADAISSLLADPARRASLGNRAAERVRERFDAATAYERSFALVSHAIRAFPH